MFNCFFAADFFAEKRPENLAWGWNNAARNFRDENVDVLRQL
jgi:hypothetical protein